MTRFIDFMKTKSLYLWSTLIFISFLYIHYQIVYFGDDYYFLTFRSYHLTEYIGKLAQFYCTDNGRLIVHFLVTLFLKLPMIFWQLFNSILLTGICLGITKIVTQQERENQNLILLTTFVLIASIEITVTRQSVYWLTGSFNYVYPCVMLLLYTFFLSKIEQKKFYYLAILFGFLSSATMEQSAMMTLGLTILVFLSHLQKGKNFKQIYKENQKLIILILITLIGTCTVLLAPAQFQRIQLEEDTLSLPERILLNYKEILAFFTRTKTILIFTTVFDLFALCFVFQQKESKKITILLAILILINLLFIVLNYYYWWKFVFLKYLFLLTFLILFGWLNHKIFHQLISPLTIAAILLIGSQLMMIISPVLGERNYLFGLLTYLFIIGIVASKVHFNKEIQYLLCFSLLLIGICYNIHTSFGYQQTKLTHEKNIQIIADHQTIVHDKNQTIELYCYPNEAYAWAMPYHGAFHLAYFKKYYDIQCEIIWK